jgi:molybdenum storage protein
LVPSSASSSRTSTDCTPLIERIGATELIERNLPSLVLDRMVIETLQNTRFIKEVQIINGLHPDRIAAALNGEHVGTIIHQER